MMTERDAALRAMALLDLTDLAEDAGAGSTRALAERALSGPVPVAAVCLWPRFVAQAKAALDGSAVRVATVVNFPAGTGAVPAVEDETRAAIAAGADEIDLVLPWQACLAGDAAAASAVVAAIRRASEGRTLKVILESGEYPDLDAVRTAADLAIAAGADFVKTSTGKTAHSASLPAAAVMLDAIADSGRPVGLKPSGGIRTLADAQAYLALADERMGAGWATSATFRFGASGLHQALLDAVSGAAGGGERSGGY